MCAYRQMLAVIFVSLFSLLGAGCDSLQGQVSASEVIPAVARKTCLGGFVL